MADPFSRTELIYGSEAMKKLKNSRVAVFGIGGVGGYVVEALARTGIGTLDLIDDDIVNYSNLNRQIYSERFTVLSDKRIRMQRCVYPHIFHQIISYIVFHISCISLHIIYYHLF